MHFERTEDGYACTLDSNPPVSITKEEFDHAHEHFFDAVEELGHVIDAIGVRAVAPGTYFTRDRVVDAVYLAELARVSLYDPAHTEPLHTFLSLLYTTYSPRRLQSIKGKRRTGVARKCTPILFNSNVVVVWTGR
jgi:hypothetical protein